MEKTNNFQESLQAIAIIVTNPLCDWQSFIKQLLSRESLENDVDCAFKMPTHFSSVWEFSNKYYKARVGIIVLKSDWSDIVSELKLRCPAIIVLWDNTAEENMQELEVVYNKLEGYHPEVCILACNNFSQTLINRQETVNWSVDHEWELIELDPILQEDESELITGEFPSEGYDRIKETLQTIQWKNMEMHAITNSSKSAQSENVASIVKSVGEDPFMGFDGCDGDVMNQHSDFPPECSFDDLFSQFERMRLTATALPHEQRLDYAERVAMAFLEAFGEKETEEPCTNSEEENKPLPSTVDDISNFPAPENIILDEGCCDTLPRLVNTTCDSRFTFHDYDYDELCWKIDHDLKNSPKESECKEVLNTADSLPCEETVSGATDNDFDQEIANTVEICPQKRLKTESVSDIYDRIEQEFIEEGLKLSLARQCEEDRIRKDLEFFELMPPH